ncbi:MAG: Xaa-Pro peptidase family protein [Dehalococcoidia bacterium]
MTSRLARLRDALREAELDALLVTNAHNRRYLSGFTGSAGWLLIGPETAALSTDFRYWEQAQSQAPDFTLSKQEGVMADWLPGFLDGVGGGKVGFEAAHVSVATHKQIRDILAAMPAPKRPGLIQTEAVVERIRALKDAQEVAALQRAVALGDEAFNAVAGRIQPGWTEKRVAWEIEMYARQHGAEAMAFPTIVGGGPWAAMPHCYPRDVPIEAGQPIVIDMGVIVDGYCSDMTRTIVLGGSDGRFQEIYDIVLTAQETAEATLEAGMSGRDAHMIAQDIIAAAGYGENFGHGLGHGVGLEIHEHPRVGRTSEDTLAEGMIITVEPGIYLPGWGGIRIEDMGVIENGKFRNFTTAPKLRMVGAD